MPDTAVKYVTSCLRSCLSRFLPELEGVCSLAAGADQMFAEAVLGVGGQLRVVVPSHNYETTFAEDSDLYRYRVLLSRAVAVEVLGPTEPSEEAFLAAGLRVVDTSDALVAVWDGLQARGRGGTADVVAYAQETRRPVEVIWPQGVLR